MNDGERREREVMKDVIKYYKNKDRDMIELVGELRAKMESLRVEVKRLRKVLRDVKSDIDSYLNGGWNGVEGWEAISSIIGALGIQTDMDLMMEESE